MDRIKYTVSLLQDFGLGNVPPEDVVAQLALLVGAQSGWLVVANRSTGTASPFAGHGLPQDIFGQYIRHYAERDVQVQALARKYGSAPPPLVTDEDAMPHREFKRSDLYNGLFEPHGIRRLMRLDSETPMAQGMGTLQLMACRSSDEAFAGPEVALFRKLLPHFRNASLHWTAANSRAWASVAALFESAADAMVVLDSDGCQHYANAAFESLRRRMEAHSRWRSLRPLDTPGMREVRRLFHAGLRSAQGTGLCARQAMVSLHEAGGARPYAAAVSALMAGVSIATARGLLFLVVLREIQAFEDERIEAVRRQYLLTAAQLRVLRELMKGHTQAEIAGRLELSVHTVHLHVKALLARTNCRRQVELVQLVEKNPGLSLRLLI